MSEKHAEQPTTALVPVTPLEYQIMTMDASTVREIVSEAIGGQSITPSDLERIRIPAGGMTAFELPTLGEPEIAKSFTGVIVAQRPGVRAYWPGKYEGGSEPPQCSSKDGRCGIGNPGGECARCPFNEFNSKDDGNSPGKACKESTMVFVLRADSIIPSLIMLPVKSAQAMKAYALRLLSKQLSPKRVVTNFALEKATNSGGIAYSRIVLSPVSVLDAAATEQIRAYAETMAPLFAAVDVADAIHDADAP